jgi:hypothetical protein
MDFRPMAARMAVIAGAVYLAVSLLAVAAAFYYRAKGHPHEWDALGAVLFAALTVPLTVVFFVLSRFIRRGRAIGVALALNVLAIAPWAFLLWMLGARWINDLALVLLAVILAIFVVVHVVSIVSLIHPLASRSGTEEAGPGR